MDWAKTTEKWDEKHLNFWYLVRFMSVILWWNVRAVRWIASVHLSRKSNSQKMYAPSLVLQNLNHIKGQPMRLIQWKLCHNSYLPLVHRQLGIFWIFWKFLHPGWSYRSNPSHILFQTIMWELSNNTYPVLVITRAFIMCSHDPLRSYFLNRF